jgi:hypothetical protein
MFVLPAPFGPTRTVRPLSKSRWNFSKDRRFLTSSVVTFMKALIVDEPHSIQPLVTRPCRGWRDDGMIVIDPLVIDRHLDPIGEAVSRMASVRPAHSSSCTGSWVTLYGQPTEAARCRCCATLWITETTAAEAGYTVLDRGRLIEGQPPREGPAGSGARWAPPSGARSQAGRARACAPRPGSR